MDGSTAIRLGLASRGDVKACDNVEKSKGYVRITVTDRALKNPAVRRAAKALVRAMGRKKK